MFYVSVWSESFSLFFVQSILSIYTSMKKNHLFVQAKHRKPKAVSHVPIIYERLCFHLRYCPSLFHEKDKQNKFKEKKENEAKEQTICR